MARNPPHKWAEQKEEKERERRGKGKESGWDQHSWEGAVTEERNLQSGRPPK